MSSEVKDDSRLRCVWDREPSTWQDYTRRVRLAFERNEKEAAPPGAGDGVPTSGASLVDNAGHRPCPTDTEERGDLLAYLSQGSPRQATRAGHRSPLGVSDVEAPTSSGAAGGGPGIQ